MRPDPPFEPDSDPRNPRTDAIRRFNRFYTQRIGVLQQRHLGGPFSLAELRILYELAHRSGPTATELANDLGIDQGYLSRILAGFERRGLVARRRSPEDGRKLQIELTPHGVASLAPLDRRAYEQVSQLLAGRSELDQERLVSAMATIEKVLGAPCDEEARVLLRAARTGEMGWILQRHGVLYAIERGWDARFEAIVARVVAEFLTRHEPDRERCWIAELEGAPVGSVMLTRKSATVAQLRLLLVEPSARGRGIGRKLVQECVRFAREAGYHTLSLWTDSSLSAARRLYEEAGFRRVRTERHSEFGEGLTAETWELAL